MADIDTRLIYAVRSGKTNDVIDLLNAGAYVNESDASDNTVLMIACDRGDIDIVKALIKKGAIVNRTARGGSESALNNACIHGYIDIVNVLLAAGADVNIYAGMHQTTLILTCRYQDVDIVNVLLEAGADVNAGVTETALIVACERGDIDIVTALIKKGADVNLVFKHYGSTGATPLMISCGHGDIDIVTALLAAGADVFARDVDGMTALTLAADNNIRDMVKAKIRQDTLKLKGRNVSALMQTVGANEVRATTRWPNRNMANFQKKIPSNALSEISSYLSGIPNKKYSNQQRILHESATRNLGAPGAGVGGRRVVKTRKGRKVGRKTRKGSKGSKGKF